MEINLKKKVLFVITQAELGGAQKFFLELLPRLDPQKYEITVAVGKQSQTEESHFIEMLKNHGLNIFQLNWLKRDLSFLFIKDWLAVFELRKLIKKIRPDTLFLNSSKAGFVGSLASVFPGRIKNLKVIYRIGGWTFNDPWPWWKRKFWMLLEKKSAKWKDAIIVNNKHDFQQAAKLKIRPREKVVLIHNGLDVYKNVFLPREEARLKLKVQAKNIIGTIANFYPAKGLAVLIKAAEHFKAHDDTVFVVIGDGKERPALKALIKDLGLERKVFLVGQLPDAFKYLSAFDIFVLPSVKEGFPWALIEAMAAKLPVVATRVGAVPEIIEDGKNGLIVEPGNPEAMAGKIKEIMDSNHLQKELGIQAHQTVLFKFEIDKMVGQIEELL